MQREVDALPGEKEPKGQSPMAAESPSDEQCFPAGHGWHASWPTEGFTEPSGHGVQEADAADPVEKEPAGQSPLTEARPDAAQCLPAGHLVQVVCPIFAAK